MSIDRIDFSRGVKLCHCCVPDEQGNPVPDPECKDCGGEGIVPLDAIETQPSGEVGDAWERQGLYESKHR